MPSLTNGAALTVLIALPALSLSMMFLSSYTSDTAAESMPLASSDRILSPDLTPFTACSPFTRASIRLVMSATLPVILAVSLPPPFVSDAVMLSMTLTCAPVEIPLSLFFSS